MAEYKLIQSDRSSLLELRVNEALKDGYMPYGQLSLMSGIHTQVMCKGITMGGGGGQAPSNKQGGGLFYYENSAPAVMAEGDKWLTLKNNGAGPATDIRFAPEGISSMLDNSSGKILMSGLSLGDRVYMRHSLILTPNLNNLEAKFQNLLGELPSQSAEPFGHSVRMSSGAGTPTGVFVVESSMYISSEDARAGGITPQIKVSGSCEVAYKGCYISVIRAGS